MGTVTMMEFWSVTLTHQHCPTVDFEPDTLEFSTWEEAATAMRRGLALDKPGTMIASVDRDHCLESDWKEDPSLSDWPAERHMVRKDR